MSHEEETHHELQKEEELRVEVAHGRFVHVTLTDGTAEIFGAEIARGAAVKLPGGKHAIFTWSGASLTLRGTPEHCYAASETPMVTYANVEGVLEKRREKARADPTTFDGPRVAGPTDVGELGVEDPVQLRRAQGLAPAVRGPGLGERHRDARDGGRRARRPADRSIRGLRERARFAFGVLPRRHQSGEQP